VSEADALRSEIEQSRAAMARTLDALSTRLDPRVQSHRLAGQFAERAQHAYQRGRAAAPPPVRKAFDRLTEAARPYAQRAAKEPKRAALVAGGTLAALLVLRRSRRH
jgi:hypothetical protein